MRTMNNKPIESISTAHSTIEDLFPLKIAIFEGHAFPVPNNIEEFLTIRYGPSYGDLPDQFGYSHHLRSW